MKNFPHFLHLVMCCLFVSMAFAEEPKVPDPKPEVKAEVVEEKLSQDEIKYIKDMFKGAVINTVLQFAVQTETSKDGGSVIAITHPKDSPVVKMLNANIFKDDLDGAIFGQVYAAKAKAGQHVLNPDGERDFLRTKINEKLKEDPKFFNVMLAAVKETIK